MEYASKTTHRVVLGSHDGLRVRRDSVVDVGGPDSGEGEHCQVRVEVAGDEKQADVVGARLCRDVVGERTIVKHWRSLTLANNFVRATSSTGGRLLFQHATSQERILELQTWRVRIRTAIRTASTASALL